MCLYFRNKSIPVFFPSHFSKEKEQGQCTQMKRTLCSFFHLLFEAHKRDDCNLHRHRGFICILYVFFVPWKNIYPLHFYTSSSDIWTHILMSDLEISIRQKLVKLWDTLTQMYLKFSRWYTFIGKHSIFLPLSFTNADANLGTIFEMYSCQGWMCDDKSGVGWGL